MPKLRNHQWKELCIYGERPTVYDFGREGWFSEDRTDPSALLFAGPEALTLTRRRRQGNDKSVLPSGLLPMVPNVIRFWDEIGLPVSPDIIPAGDAGQVPPGHRLLLGAYNPKYNRDGQFDRWRDVLMRVRTRSGFVGYLREKRLDHLLPTTHRYGPDGPRGLRPSQAFMEEYFALAEKWWVKLDEEVLNEHPVTGVTSVEEMNEAIDALGEGAAFIIQEHVEGDSYSISYEVAPSGRAVHDYTAVEMVVDSSQLGAWSHPVHDWVRKFADPVAQVLADDGVEHHLGLGFIGNRKTGKAKLNDNNIRQQGGHPVWQFGQKMRQAGVPDLVDEFYYEYLDPGRFDGPGLLEAILHSPLRPDLSTGEGIWPVGWHPNGSGKYAAYGPNCKATVAAAKEEFGLHLRIQH